MVLAHSRAVSVPQNVLLHLLVYLLVLKRCNCCSTMYSAIVAVQNFQSNCCSADSDDADAMVTMVAVLEHEDLCTFANGFPGHIFWEL